MSISAEARSRHSAARLAVLLAAQALLWAGLAVASAALPILMGFPAWTWRIGLRFAMISWMPWAVLAPLVFWFSSRYPLERGHLATRIAAHGVACAACIAAIGATTYFSYHREHLLRAGNPPKTGTQVSGGGEMFITRGPPLPDAAAAPRGEVIRERFPRPRLFRRPIWARILFPLRGSIDGPLYLIIAIAAHALVFYRRAQDRERHAIALAAGLNRAKLDALRLQLQPHFLFNALNAIATLVHRDATAADELIGDLSELLRLSLQTAEHEVPLARELELLDRYLAIETMRLGDRLRIVRAVDPRSVAAMVPTFVLQPLVENAVRHGIEPRLAPGTVTIETRREGATLVLSVSDDGVGLSASADAAREGIGIRNTEARLRALHGAAAQLEIKSTDSGGVDVRITLPFSTTPRPEIPPDIDVLAARSSGPA